MNIGSIYTIPATVAFRHLVAYYWLENRASDKSQLINSPAVHFELAVHFDLVLDPPVCIVIVNYQSCDNTQPTD